MAHWSPCSSSSIPFKDGLTPRASIENLTSRVIDMGTFTQRSKVRSISEEFYPWNDRQTVERRKLQEPVVNLEESPVSLTPLEAVQGAAVLGPPLSVKTDVKPNPQA
jgi:hypothetical protein